MYCGMNGSGGKRTESVVVHDFFYLNFVNEWKKTNKGSGKINFILLLNSVSILPTKLYTLGYKNDGPASWSFQFSGRQTYK